MPSSLIDPLAYSAYEKITDDLYWLSSNFLLRFNVVLAHYDRDGENRSIFHKEFKYPTEKSGNKFLKTIRRSFDYYLSLETYFRRNGEDRIFIPIKVQDIISVRIGLQAVFDWFNDKQYEGLYVTKNGRLMMTSPAPSYIISQLPGGSYIEFKPIIIDRQTGMDDKEPGIFMGMSDSFGIRLTLNRFMGFKYIIDSINMYESAQLMLNYLGRPEFGSFQYSFTTEEDRNEGSITAWERVDKQDNNSNRQVYHNVNSMKRLLPGSKAAKSIESLE